MKRAKCLLVSILMTIFVFSAVPAHSQNFALGLAMGAVLFDNGNKAGASAMVIYTLPDASQRVKNPLDIRMVSVYENFSVEYDNTGAKMSLAELFGKTVVGYQQYEVLQIVRVFRGDMPQKAAIWFCYIEKNKILPPLKKE